MWISGFVILFGLVILIIRSLSLLNGILCVIPLKKEVSGLGLLFLSIMRPPLNFAKILSMQMRNGRIFCRPIFSKTQTIYPFTRNPRFGLPSIGTLRRFVLLEQLLVLALSFVCSSLTSPPSVSKLLSSSIQDFRLERSWNIPPIILAKLPAIQEAINNVAFSLHNHKGIPI